VPDVAMFLEGDWGTAFGSDAVHSGRTAWTWNREQHLHAEAAVICIAVRAQIGERVAGGNSAQKPSVGRVPKPRIEGQSNICT
jgi:hypothetical protein